MLALMLHAITPVTDTSKDVVISNTLVYVVGGIALTIFLWVGHKLSQVVKFFKQLMEILVTRKPSQLEPNPPLGIIDMVWAHERAFKSTRRTLGVLLTGQKAILNMREIDRDPKADGHNLTREEAMRRIEEEQHRLVVEDHLEGLVDNDDRTRGNDQ